MVYSADIKYDEYVEVSFTQSKKVFKYKAIVDDNSY